VSTAATAVARRRPAAADPHPPRRRRPAPVQHHHDARHAARRDAAGAANRDVRPDRRRLGDDLAACVRSGSGGWGYLRSGGPRTGVVRRTRIR
jgi:hypothetical protein